MASAIRFSILIRAFCAAGLGGVAFADGVAMGGTVSSGNASAAVSSGAGISLLGYVLTIVVLAGAGLAVLFRGAGMGGFRGIAKGPRKLNVEETRALGHRQYLVVAEYEGRRFLLGVCPGRIEYLSGLDADGVSPGGSFQEILSTDISQGEKGKEIQ
jgi:flagellar protein FliO/FliZ